MYIEYCIFFLFYISKLFICIILFFFFFNDTATTEIYTLSLHDALPICDHHQLDRLQTLPVDLARDHLGLGYLELESLAAHHLDQDRELELAAPRDLGAVGGIRVLDPDRDVAQRLLEQPLPHLARRHVAPVFSR